jgi:hypothetical protein
MKPAKSLRLAAKLKRGQSKDAAIAHAMVEGIRMNAGTAVTFSKGWGEIDLTEAVTALGAQVRRVQSGDLGGAEAMLIAQAVALNALFTGLAHVASKLTAVDHIDRIMRLGLRAQGQCRATLETLALIKNPPAVFARQANIANGPQQVNNGLMPAQAASDPARAGNPETAPIELLEAHGKRLDAREAGTAGNRDTTLAALGTLDRPKNGRRKGAGIPQR